MRLTTDWVVGQPDNRIEYIKTLNFKRRQIMDSPSVEALKSQTVELMIQMPVQTVFDMVTTYVNRNVLKLTIEDCESMRDFFQRRAVAKLRDRI